MPAEFPAPSHRSNVLQNVTIEDMSIQPFGTTSVASGIVFAKVVLPKIVNIEVFRVFPEVLMFKMVRHLKAYMTCQRGMTL